MRVAAFIAVCILLLLTDFALAANCPGVAGAPVDPAMKRQLAALQAMYGGRGCTAQNSTGGFFNPCRDLTRQMSDVRQRIARAAPSSRDCAPTGQAAQRVKKPATSTASRDSGQKQAGAPAISGKALTYCVRLSDGYYFPAPNSQFQTKGGTATALAQCRLICETDAMELFVLGDPNRETADMVSVNSSRSYSDLPTAYAYQGGAQFSKCNWAGYIQKEMAYRSTRFQRRALSNASIPVPDSKPDEEQTTVSVAVQAPFQAMNDRAVRPVGPEFMYETPSPAMPAAYH